MNTPDSEVERSMLTLLKRRAPESSICPSEVARDLASDESTWRALMPLVREVAARLARDGAVSITQGGVALNPDAIGRGPIRLIRGPKFE
ncbi:hypothetical protein AWB77_05958 [Caballeronia fortuita]|uniref:S-adenosylmethionine tRNA ribosyltransferase n=1 Tax=Caballeronia fortuita TaxID=1777138 RepID=A0A158DXH8_9BURK|nr:DUF3253 domain-containing protein [Caballeronia fortuita]SAK99278.1 hypothetical protein AWB77_05958 [Caballeronia fortuita]